MRLLFLIFIIFLSFAIAQPPPPPPPPGNNNGTLPTPPPLTTNNTTAPPSATTAAPNNGFPTLPPIGGTTNATYMPYSSPFESRVSRMRSDVNDVWRAELILPAAVNSASMEYVIQKNGASVGSVITSVMTPMVYSWMPLNTSLSHWIKDYIVLSTSSGESLRYRFTLSPSSSPPNNNNNNVLYQTEWITYAGRQPRLKVLGADGQSVTILEGPITYENSPTNSATTAPPFSTIPNPPTPPLTNTNSSNDPLLAALFDPPVARQDEGSWNWVPSVVPAVVQQQSTGALLLSPYMNSASVQTISLAPLSTLYTISFQSSQPNAVQWVDIHSLMTRTSSGGTSNTDNSTMWTRNYRMIQRSPTLWTHDVVLDENQLLAYRFTFWDNLNNRAKDSLTFYYQSRPRIVPVNASQPLNSPNITAPPTFYQPTAAPPMSLNNLLTNTSNNGGTSLLPLQRPVSLPSIINGPLNITDFNTQAIAPGPLSNGNGIFPSIFPGQLLNGLPQNLPVFGNGPQLPGVPNAQQPPFSTQSTNTGIPPQPIPIVSVQHPYSLNVTQWTQSTNQDFYATATASGLPSNSLYQQLLSRTPGPLINSNNSQNNGPPQLPVFGTALATIYFIGNAQRLQGADIQWVDLHYRINDGPQYNYRMSSQPQSLLVLPSTVNISNPSSAPNPSAPITGSLLSRPAQLMYSYNQIPIAMNDTIKYSFTYALAPTPGTPSTNPNPSLIARDSEWMTSYATSRAQADQWIASNSPLPIPAPNTVNQSDFNIASAGDPSNVLPLNGGPTIASVYPMQQALSLKTYPVPPNTTASSPVVCPLLGYRTAVYGVSGPSLPSNRQFDLLFIPTGSSMALLLDYVIAHIITPGSPPFNLVMDQLGTTPTAYRAQLQSMATATPDNPSHSTAVIPLNDTIAYSFTYHMLVLKEPNWQPIQCDSEASVFDPTSVSSQFTLPNPPNISANGPVGPFVPSTPPPNNGQNGISFSGRRRFLRIDNDQISITYH